MKAVVYTRYGQPDVLEFKEIKKPTPKDGEVLIRVEAVSLNGSDREALTGSPFYARLSGLFRPRRHILGSDIAGQVESVGRNAHRFKPGDAVFGDILPRMGGLAEYVCAPETDLAFKPVGMTFETAAAIPQAAVITLQGIRDKGKVQPGQKVLINGAGGSAGTFALQLAKWYGAEVTAVDNAAKLDFLRSLGADHVIDYTREDFTSGSTQYDLILDVIAHRSAWDYARALRPGGRYYCVGGSTRTILHVLLLGSWITRTQGKHVRVLAVQPNLEDMLYMTELCESGALVPIIDRQYPLAGVPEALRYLGEGHAKGKVVINVANHGTAPESAAATSKSGSVSPAAVPTF